MKILAPLFATVLLAACSSPQGEADKIAEPAAASTGVAPTSAPMADMPAAAGTQASATGTVESVDAKAGKITIAHGPVECGKGLRVGGHLTGEAGLRAGQGIVVGGAITGGAHLDAGWGIKAGECIHAQGAIKAGESLCAGGEICAGPGYGVFAGLHVQQETWEASAQVWSRERPEGLRSGVWLGPSAV